MGMFDNIVEENEAKKRLDTQEKQLLADQKANLDKKKAALTAALSPYIDKAIDEYPSAAAQIKPAKKWKMVKKTLFGEKFYDGYVWNISVPSVSGGNNGTYVPYIYIDKNSRCFHAARHRGLGAMVSDDDSFYCCVPLTREETIDCIATTLFQLLLTNGIKTSQPNDFQLSFTYPINQQAMSVFEALKDKDYEKAVYEMFATSLRML